MYCIYKGQSRRSQWSPIVITCPSCHEHCWFVLGPPSITLQPSQTVYALIGQRVTLECIAEGDPTPSVYWIEPSQPRRGDLAPDGLAYDVYEGSAILDIANVGREDQGYYTCVATNTGGRTEDSLQLIGMLLQLFGHLKPLIFHLFQMEN